MMTAHEKFDRVGTMPHRSYYIPYEETDSVGMVYGIPDRTTSSRFLSLDGLWRIRRLEHVSDFCLEDAPDKTIPVPACVQMHGFDGCQYINARFPIPVMPPHVPYENPCWHYRRCFTLDKRHGEKYYLQFEGVDSGFYLYVNGVQKGFSQISHATSAFDITELVNNGENTLDVLVLKWCAATYLECQDKLRFSGIFRSVYLLRRPESHITDYKIETRFSGENGILTFCNESALDIRLELDGTESIAPANAKTEVILPKVKTWTAEEPNLYPLTLFANGEKIVEQVGFREVSIDGKVFKLNGLPIKLKGVNRHDFHCETGATVTLADMVQDLRLMKELNVNAVRTSHYPNCPEFYLLCNHSTRFQKPVKIHSALHSKK